MALLFGALSMLVGLPTYLYINSQHRAQLIEHKRETLQGVAHSTATILAESLAERYREIILLTQSPQFKQSPLYPPEVRASIERVKQSYAHYSWIGVADVRGRVLSASSAHLEGADVAQRPWFQEGLKAPFIGDVHEAVLLAKLLPNPSPDQPLRFIDFSAPIRNQAGNVIGVLGAHAQWQWAGNLLATITPAHATRDGIDLFILNGNGEIIYPETVPDTLHVPDLQAWANNPRHAFLDWGQDERFLTTYAQVHTPELSKPLDWRVVVRQVEPAVLAEVKNLQHINILTMVLAGIAFLLLAWVAANRISRPVEALTHIARRIESGEKKVRFIDTFWAQELQRLSDALRSMSNTLIAQKDALARSNQDLEAKVSARTAELQQLNIKLEQLARTDALTNLPNRMRTNERLSEEFALFKRSHLPYSILMLDVDFFKRVNDTYGHAAGDTVLKHVAIILQSTVRQTDFVGRTGGEEFLAILPLTDVSAAMQVAEKIRNTIASTPIAPVGNVTISIGVQEVQADDTDADTAVTRADEWLYQAKAAGRNKVMSEISI